VTRAVIVSVARIIGATLAATPMMLPMARAGTTSSGINASGTAGYSSNPFLLDTPGGGVASGSVSVSPFIEEKSARSSLRVGATAGFTKYSSRYRDSINLSSQVGYSQTISRQLSVNAGLSLNSSIGGSYFTDPAFTTPLPTDVVPPIVDITLVGLQSRTTSVQASTGLSYTPDNKNSFNLGYNGSIARFPGARGRSEYTNVSQSAGYSRVISSRLNAGLSVSVARVNYLGTALGDAVIISPSVNASLRVARQWTLSGGVGFSSTRVNSLGGKFTSTDLSASINACRTDTRTSFCLNGSRSTGASSFDGVRTTSSFGTSYSYKITSRDTISASGGYSRSAAPRLSARGATSYLSGTTTYSRRFASNISGQIIGGFTRSTFEGTRSNAYASIGLTYNFGGKR
jgi:hypothetical protein